MCGPALGAVAAIGGSVVSAAGASSQANAQAAARERQAQTREINAITAREDAAAKADRKEDEHEYAIAAQGPQAAANGLVPAGGSFDDIRLASKQAKLMDIDELMRQGEAEAVNEENLARSDRAAAADIRQSGKIQAFSSILGGFSSAAKGMATQIA